MIRWIALSALLALPTIAGATELAVCFDYGCKSHQRVTLTRMDWQEIEQAFGGTASSAPVERHKIASAIAAFERVVGRYTGTNRDRGGNFAGSGTPGQMDCIDESRNTTHYLQVLESQGLLGWHRVGEREFRAPWLVDEHWAATLEEQDGGARFAVDSWFLDNGKRPYIQVLNDWKRKRDLPPNPDAP